MHAAERARASLEGWLEELRSGEVSEVPGVFERVHDTLLDADELVDQLSFDLFDAALPRAPAMPQAARVLDVVMQSASAREVLCMVMGAFASHPPPLAQTMLLRSLPPVLGRIRRQ